MMNHRQVLQQLRQTSPNITGCRNWVNVIVDFPYIMDQVLDWVSLTLVVVATFFISQAAR